MTRLPVLQAIAAFILFALVFLSFPGIDLWASSLFYSANDGFFLSRHPVAMQIRNAVNDLTPVLIIALLYFLFLSGLQPALGPQRKAVIYMLLLLVLGPGLLVNSVFKEHWGRARPKDVAEFGGERQFRPALLPTNQCDHNCSFTCGDASVGFYLVGLAFLFPRRRRTWLAAGIGAGTLIGLVRMVQGAHFFSDVVFSFFAVYFVAALLHFLMYRGDRTGSTAGAQGP